MTSPRSHAVPYSVRESEVLREAAAREASVRREAATSANELLFPPDLRCPVCNGPVLDVVMAGGGPGHPRVAAIRARYVCRNLACRGQLSEMEASMTREFAKPDRIIMGERVPRDD